MTPPDRQAVETEAAAYAIAYYATNVIGEACTRDDVARAARHLRGQIDRVLDAIDREPTP